MTVLRCRDCDLPYEAWPEGFVCVCGSAEPKPPAPPEFDGTGVPMEAVDVGPGEDVEVPPDYGAWTVAELRAECTRRGLPTSGTKAVLVGRLGGGG